MFMKRCLDGERDHSAIFPLQVELVLLYFLGTLSVLYFFILFFPFFSFRWFAGSTSRAVRIY